MKIKFIIALSLYLIIIQSALSQESCGDIPSSGAANIATDCDGEILSGLEIKLYFHVYRDINGQGGQPASRLNQIVENLNEYFSETGFSIYYNSCETRWVNDDDLFGSSVHCDFWEFNNHTNGIDVHLLKDNGSFIARAKSIPSDEIILGGMRDGLPAALTSSAPHEIGHCLGLFHTHHNSCPDYTTICGSDDLIWFLDISEGDYISDTPYDVQGAALPSNNCEFVFSNIPCVAEICDGIDNDPSDNIGIDEDTSWDFDNDGIIDLAIPCLADLPTPHTKNIMSYYHHQCRTEFTTCQILRMQELAPPLIFYNGPEKQCCGDYKLEDGSNVQDLVILLGLNNSSELLTANADIMIEGDFYVDELMQTSEGLNFYMAPGSRFIIKEDITFYKVGGFFTSCSDNWDGIISTGGTVYLRDVKISEANTSLTLYGGSAVIDFCEILSCDFGIQMFDA